MRHALYSANVEFFGPATKTWFSQSFEAPTPVQVQGWKSIYEGHHSLLIAPTGSGKTLAAFLWCLDRLSRRDPLEAKGVRTIYVSPLKALVYDVERNLRAPLVGIERAASTQGISVHTPSVGVRTGDTPPKERQRQLKHPPDILVTTPESLYLLLIGQARENFATVDTVIIDEVHALAPTKRGAHLSLSLERLAADCAKDPQRIGLSATATPLEEVARFLGGDRDVAIVDTSAPPRIQLSIVVPVPDMTRPTESLRLAQARGEVPVPVHKEPEEPEDLGEPVVVHPPAVGEPLDNSIWPAVYPRLLELIDSHRTTIIFVNSRGLCERLAQRLIELAGKADLVRAHHGSVAREQREQIEEMLKTGQIKAIVATSSLELGIDMGAVDLVVLVESPGAVARGLQRIGRAGHSVGEVSQGRIFPKHRGDLLECAVVTQRMHRGDIEPLRYLRNPLDVLAQQVVAMCAVRSWGVDELARLVKRSANFTDLPQDAFVGVLDMLAGRYPSHAFADLRSRITWDRDEDTLTARRGAKQIAVFNAGTIPDRGSYGVFLGENGPRLGELDEEMVHESASGQNILLGATSWRIQQITRDRVIVSPAPGEPGKLPFWRGDGPGRPAELGRAMGAFTRTIAALPEAEAEAVLQADYALDPWAAKNLVAYISEQREATGTLPSDQAITVERFRDELGDWRICILSALGARVHAPWALAVQASLEAQFGFEVQAMWSDDGIVLRLVDAEDLPELEHLLPNPDEVEDLVVEQLAHCALFAGQFRENAGRSLLLPRQRANARTPLWQQRLKSQQLLAVAREFPSFPIIIETYRACLQDVFDLPELTSTLRAIQRRELRVDVVETSSPSPFASSLVFAYVAAFLYEGDAPLAERKAQALALDRKLLRDLLGHEELRELLDAEVIEQLECELQGLDPDYRARHGDALHELLRKVGDLSKDELCARCDPPEAAPDWCETLINERRIVLVPVGGQPRFVAVEDVALYRDGLGSTLPIGVPKVFLDAAPDAFATLTTRYARTHGPFEASTLAARYQVSGQRVVQTLVGLEPRGDVVQGEFRPGGTRQEWCNAEVLRRIKRRTLAKLRGEIAPVESARLGRFLPAWHGIGLSKGYPGRLEEALVQLEGLPLSYAELEGALLPARVPGFTPRMLDELGAMGWLVWVGHGALGKSDGRVAFYRRERASLLLEPPQLPDDLDPIHHRLLERLGQRGACFFSELQAACPEARVAELRESLWDLVWHGLVTNDTLGALRAFGQAKKAGKGRRVSKGLQLSTSGRWSLVSELVQERSETERAHARAVTLLERHGIVAREVANLEPHRGGFSAVYRVLRAMEESGKVRRGYFVEGLGGAQFASPGAVDRLRGMRAVDDKDALVLSAVDPANPYGWLLAWPVRDTNDAVTPRRVAGAHVVLVGGQPVFYIDRAARKLSTFPASDDPQLAQIGVQALIVVARRQRGKMLRLEQVDDAPARTSFLLDTLTAVGFVSDPKGLVLEA